MKEYLLIQIIENRQTQIAEFRFTKYFIYFFPGQIQEMPTPKKENQSRMSMFSVWFSPVIL